MTAPAVSFVQSLVARFPVFGGIYEEHVDDNSEVLPHMLFGDIVRQMVPMHPEDAERISEVLAFLDAAYGAGDPDVQNLLEASFLENLPCAGEAGAGIRDLLGPNLRNKLRDMGC